MTDNPDTDLAKRNLELAALNIKQAIDIDAKRYVIDGLRAELELARRTSDGLRQRLQEAVDQRDFLDTELAAAKRTIEALTADVAVIREELQSEAEHRDWCAEYQEFCDRVNGRLTNARLGPELSVFKVVHEYTVRVHATVDAFSPAHADRRALEQYQSITEAKLFHLPDDPSKAFDEDTGDLVNVRWFHSNTKILPEGEDY